MEKRLLLAFAISAVILGVWTVLFPPPKQPAPTAPEVAVESTAVPAGAEQETPQAAETPDLPAPEPKDEIPEDVRPAIAGEVEQTTVLEDELVKMTVTNRGGCISSLILKKYDDDEGRPLELVQDVDLKGRALPLQLMVDGTPDARLYKLERDGNTVNLEWSDGQGDHVVKKISLGTEPYQVGVAVKATGRFRAAGLALGTGMRNIGPREQENRFSTWGDAVLGGEGKPDRVHRTKVKEETTKPAAGLRFLGFEDTYFLMVLRPTTPLKSVVITPFEVPAPEGSKEKTDTILRIQAVPQNGVIEGTLFAAPKEYDLLQRVDQGVEGTLHFGIFHPVSVLFLKALRWINGLVGNYGVAIILLTLLIRIVLFPLMHTSTVSMRKMQTIQPKVKAIQEKYKKTKKDPQSRAKMNQEVMELYKVEGVNPMGGCLPMLIQLPLLWALYTLFAYAIELRHAPFMFWIVDLSAKDPYYITPILMTFTMWLQQKLAPQAGDPQQQKMFRLMPFIFGFMFLGFPAGLVLYWLMNNVFTILQQEVTFHLMGERSSGRKKGGRK